MSQETKHTKNLVAILVMLTVVPVLPTGCTSLHKQDVAEPPGHVGCVVIEAKFIEISEEHLNELGIEWLHKDWPNIQPDTEGKSQVD